VEPWSLSEKLEEYLDSLNDGRSDHSIGNVSEINMGWETELFTLRHRFTEKGAPVTEDLVLRVFSGDGAASKASKEYHLMRKLHDVGYPVPPVYNLETSGEIIGKPFIVMKRIMGKTLDAAYDNESAQQQREGLSRLMRLFVQLHGLDVSEFKDVPNLPFSDSVQTYLGYFRDTRDRLAPWMTPVIDWIADNMPGDAPEYRSLCHMDYHGMNIMLDEDDRPYVIDWGASRIGDSRLDVAWTILLYSTFGGPKFRAPLIEAYESLGGRLERLEFFEVMAAARRVTDLITVTAGSGSAGLKPNIVQMMRESKDHFNKVHDFLEERTGIRLAELDGLLKSF
jgi:aminoglycoside phosphotransferase (APT) family kinase protein